MGLRIANNIAAMNTHRWLGAASLNFNKSLERLSSGYRINKAADDAAGLSVSQQFRADIASYQMASRNVSEATALLQVAEGAMDQIGNMLTRLKELATQASSTNASANLSKINAEGNKLINEIDRIANSTEYAGTKLLNGTFGVSVSSGTWTASDGLSSVSGLESGVTYNITVVTSGTSQHNITISATLGGGRVSETQYDVAVADTNSTREIKFESLGLTLTVNDNVTATGGAGVATGTIIAATATASDFQVGAKNTVNDRIGILLSSIVGTSSTGLNLSTDQLLSASNAQTFLDTLDTAIGTMNARRGTVGATQNRLMYATANLATIVENAQAAESAIRDVDMAFEMVTFTKNQILLQAGTAMLAQANLAPQVVLQLLG
ncbi:MAG: flagellin [Thermodesulfobacteriota bacterium]|nr:flagellin [Thermodesulfobacteriota bacterium]